MQNAFVFDGSHGVTAYLQKLEGLLIWQFCLLEQVEILPSVECSYCLSVIWRVPVPVYSVVVYL
mgnify:CR=1 FL=1